MENWFSVENWDISDLSWGMGELFPFQNHFWLNICSFEHFVAQMSCESWHNTADPNSSRKWLPQYHPLVFFKYFSCVPILAVLFVFVLNYWDLWKILVLLKICFSKHFVCRANQNCTEYFICKWAGKECNAKISSFFNRRTALVNCSNVNWLHRFFNLL